VTTYHDTECPCGCGWTVGSCADDPRTTDADRTAAVDAVRARRAAIYHDTGREWLHVCQADGTRAQVHRSGLPDGAHVIPCPCYAPRTTGRIGIVPIGPYVTRSESARSIHAAALLERGLRGAS
jgi:hypothetical protein